MLHSFKLKNAVLLMALSAVYPLQSHASAGIAQFAVGDVNVRRGTVETAVNRGQQIESGDQVLTGRSGQTQIRFSDGGLVSLAPNSQFNIDRYADENKPEDGFFASLLRGGMRAVTGLVGKRNRESYRISTNTATIGIRGSAFSANYNADGSLNVAGEQDGIVVCTQAGCVELIVGEVVRVTGNNQLPVRTSERSNVPPLVARQDLFVPENPAVIPLISLEGRSTQTGVSAMFVGDTSYGYLFDYYPRGGYDPSSGSGDFIGNAMYLHDDGEDSNGYGYGGTSNTMAVTGTTSNFGSIGNVSDPDFIGWGYWAQGRRSDGTDLTNVHYIVGRPSTYNEMPRDGEATYSLVGGTLPTATNGSTTITGRLLGASMAVDFYNARASASISTEFTTGGTTTPVTINDTNIYLSGSTFCGNNVNGFFTGSMATRAGLIYRKDTDSSLGIVSGAAGLARGPITPTSNGN